MNELCRQSNKREEDSNLERFNLWFAKWQFKSDLKNRKKLYRKLATFLKNGARLDVALEDMLKRYQRENPKHPFAVCLESWLLTLRRGKSFSEAITGWVPDDEKMFLKAGEDDIQKAFTTVTELLTANEMMAKTLKKGFIVPVIFLTIAVALMLFYAYVLIPTFLESAPKGAVFTGMAGAVQSTTAFVRDWLVLILAVLLGIIALIFYSLPRWTGKLRIVCDKFFPWKIYRIKQGLGWLLALSALTSQGYKTFDAMTLLSEGANPWLKQRLDAVIQNQKNKMDFGAALIETPYQFPDQDILDDIAVYSQDGDFDKALEIVANEWIKESQESLELMFKIFGFFSLIAMLSTLAFLALGMMAIPAQITTIMKSSL